MIITQLIGGLGNQLFQYATGRRLAHINQTALKLDVMTFETYKLHNYSLQHFQIVEDFASEAEIKRLQRKGIVRKFIRLVDKLSLPIRFSHVIERHLRFDPAILNLRGDIYLEGYWQTEKYFADIVPILRTELNIKTAPDPENEAAAERIQGVKGVSLHIRRGDYASDPATRQRHGLLPLGYYDKAIQHMAGQVSMPHFFIFSDDPLWAQANLHIDYPTTHISHNRADRNYEDLRLMSLCQHHIIANSSFSWWGAWLNPNPAKIVVAPAQWANDPELNYPERIPAGWQRV